MPYTNVTKPSGTSYSTVNPTGREQFDQADVTYDSSTVFYDSINQSQYTTITKPSGTSYTNIAKPS